MVAILVILGTGLPSSFAASLGHSISTTGTLIYEEAFRISIGTWPWGVQCRPS